MLFLIFFAILLFIWLKQSQLSAFPLFPSSGSLFLLLLAFWNEKWKQQMPKVVPILVHVQTWTSDLFTKKPYSKKEESKFNVFVRSQSAENKRRLDNISIT